MSIKNFLFNSIAQFLYPSFLTFSHSIENSKMSSSGFQGTSIKVFIDFLLLEFVLGVFGGLLRGQMARMV